MSKNHIIQLFEYILEGANLYDACVEEFSERT